MIQVETSNKRRLWFGAALAAFVATAAQAQPNYAVNIGAANLEPGLLALASQTHQQIFFPKTLVAGLHAPALKGSFTPDEAVAALLAGSGLHARRVSAELIIVERPAAAPDVVRTGSDPKPGRPFAADRVAADAPLPANPKTANLEAQATPPALVEEVEITGSHIRGASTASPLLILSHADLERSGQTTVVDALRALPQNFGGGASEGTLNTGGDPTGRNSAFGSALNLRGLGNNATLVLVNGRRLARSGTFGDFSDVSSIPRAAVERVEVLLDGASALYGSDAVVVNIITRKDYEGAETRVFGRIGTAGEPAQGQFSQTFGKRWTDGGLVFAYEFQRRENLPGGARPFSADADLRPLGGTDRRQINSFPGNILRTDPVTRALVPGVGDPRRPEWRRPASDGPGVRCRQPGEPAPRRGHPPQQTLHAVYLSADQALGDRLEVSADARGAEASLVRSRICGRGKCRPSSNSRKMTTKMAMTPTTSAPVIRRGPGAVPAHPGKPVADERARLCEPATRCSNDRQRFPRDAADHRVDVQRLLPGRLKGCQCQRTFRSPLGDALIGARAKRDPR